jgi:hypothetical protein
MTELRAVLLVFDDRHPLIESSLGPRVQRFTDQNTCVNYILNEMGRCRQIDLFLSSANRNIIGTNLPLFNNIYFHLYCPNADDIPNNEVLFPQRAYVHVFEEDYLWVEISYVILGHDNTRIRMSNYSNEARATWERTHSLVSEEVEAAKLGVQPD